MKPLKFYSKMPTQREIAKALQISEDYVSKLLRGERSNIAQLDRINSYLDKCTKRELAS